MDEREEYARDFLEGTDVDDEQDIESEGLSIPIPLPPEQTYPLLNELKGSVRAWTRKHGYDLVRASSQGSGRRKFVRCGRGGVPRNSRNL